MIQQCPDWKNADTYSFMKDYALHEWGWEFIRRDDRYISEWRQVFNRFKQSKKRGHLSFDELSKSEFEYLCETHDFDFYREYISNTNRIDFTDRFKFIIPDIGASKWGMKNYQHPKSRCFNEHNLLGSKIVYFDTSSVGGENSDTVELERKANVLVAEIDLEKAIRPQIKKLENMASREQANLGGARKRATTPTVQNCDIWIKYLRCIDSQRLGVKRTDAADIIFENLKPTSELGDANIPFATWDNTKTKIEKHRSNYFSFFMP